MPRRDQPIEAEALLAYRNYLVDGSRGCRHLRIAVGFPKKTSFGRYECQAEISDDDECIVRTMSGVDALEALMLAMINIGTELHLFTDATDRFTWLDGQESGLRFPILPEYTLNAVFRPSSSSE